MRYLVFLLISAFGSPAIASVHPPSVPTPIKVILYPFLPSKDSYFRQIETDFEKRYPAIDLQLIDLSANYYDEDSPDAVTNTVADVIELDSVFLDDFITAGKAQEIPEAIARPAGTFLDAAEQSVKHNGKIYGVPHWVCSNFLFSTKADPINAGNLQDLMREIGSPHEKDKGLLIDLKGRSTLGEWYLDSLIDRHKTLQAALPFINETGADKEVYSALTDVRTLCDSDLCRQSRYHDATGFYPVQFARHNGRALAGYSERLYYVGIEDLTNCKEGECLSLDDIVIGSLSLSDGGTQPFLWVDSFIISPSCSGTCLTAAETFLSYMNEPANVRAILTPGYGEAPRYLLPAQKSLYSDEALIAAAPLYSKFYPLIENAIPVRSLNLNRRLRAIGSVLDKSVIPK